MATINELMNQFDPKQIEDMDYVYEAKDLLNSISSLLPKVYFASLTPGRDPLDISTDWNSLTPNYFYQVDSFDGLGAPTDLGKDKTGLAIVLETPTPLQIAFSSKGKWAMRKQTAMEWDYGSGADDIKLPDNLLANDGSAQTITGDWDFNGKLTNKQELLATAKELQDLANKLLTKADNDQVVHRDPDTFTVKDKTNFNTGELTVANNPVVTVVGCTQEQYDSMPSHDPNTLYVIDNQ